MRYTRGYEDGASLRVSAFRAVAKASPVSGKRKGRRDVIYEDALRIRWEIGSERRFRNEIRYG